MPRVLIYILVSLVSISYSDSQQCLPIPSCAVDAVKKFEKTSTNLIAKFKSSDNGKTPEMIMNAIQSVVENFIFAIYNKGIEDLKAFIDKGLLEIESTLDLGREQLGVDTLDFARLAMRISTNAMNVLRQVLNC